MLEKQKAEESIKFAITAENQPCNSSGKKEIPMKISW